jgi:hypothetical protein
VPSPTSPFWVADQNTSESTLYMSNSATVPLVVQIPCTVDGAVTTPCPYPTRGQFFEPLAGKKNLFGPTGIVWNAFSTNGAFAIPGSSQPASFIFATLDGLIVGWNAQVNRTQGVVVADRSANAASYSGLAIASPAGTPREDLIQASFLYATNSAPGGKIDVFDSRFNLVSSFDADAKVPTGFAPYGIQAFGNKLYVTYFNPTGQGGILDVCDLTTNLTAPDCRRLYISLPLMPAPAAGRSATTVANPVLQTTVLNGPWGMALAPAGFGPLSNMLLVGNVNDGTIHAFDPDTGAFTGTLALSSGKPFAMPGLWALQFGQGAAANGARNQLFFTAGPAPASNPTLLFSEGLFGTIVAANARPGIK